jgi:hypothetical protein
MRFLSLLPLIVFLPHFLFAQEGEMVARSAMEKSYEEKLPLLQDIAMGGVFEEHSLKIKGSPRFQKSAFEKGQLTINGLQYQNVQLSYDIYADELLTFHSVFAKKIKLQPEKVNEFRFSDGTRFIYKSTNPGYLHHRNGYYELLWDDGVRILAKHRKVSKSISERGDYPFKYVHKTNFFIEKGEEMFQVRKASQAIKFLELEKREVRQNSRSEGVKFRKDPSAYLRMLGRLFTENKEGEI